MEERQEKVVMEIREKEALEMVEALAKSLDQSQKMINHLGILMLQLNLIKDRFRPAMNRAGVGLAEEKDDASQAPL